MKIFTECHAETYLLKFLGFSPIHQKKGGMSRIYQRMETKRKTSNETILGIVDNDIVVPEKDIRFKLTRKSQFGILYYKNENSGSFLIKQNPDFEGWILNISKMYRLLPKTTKFNTVKDLKEITKHQNRLLRDKQFNDLLNQIDNLEDSPFDEIRDFINNLRVL